MNKSDVSKIANGVRRFASQRSPEILIGIGLVSAATTVILTAQATVKAVRLLDEKKKEKIAEQVNTGMDYEEVELELTKKEVIQTTWKPYVSAAVTGAFSVACILGANSVHAKRNAALAAAYEISTSALSDYREKVLETIGEKKERAIRDKVTKERMEKNPSENATVFITGGGDTLCYDMHSDRYFRSSIDKIKRAVNNLNQKMTGGGEMYISLNEFYDEIGLNHTTVGDRIGWRNDRGLIDIHYGTQLTDNEEPCITIDFLIPPEYEFDKLY